MYASVADLVARFTEEQLVQLSDRSGAGVVDDAVVEQAIADASAVVDGYLAGRYADQLPLSPVPSVVVSYVCDLARANLYTDAMPDEVDKRAARATRFFELVGQGKLNLGASPEPASSDTVEVVTTGRRRHGIGL